MALDPWASTNARIDESKAALLKATAQGGKAGREAFEQAQAGISANRQAAVGHALDQSMGLTGRNIGQENITGLYDSRLGALDSAKAGFASGIAGTEASGVSYLEKVRATMPVLQEQNKAKLDIQESEIKRAIELAKQEAEAKAAEKAAAEQATIDRENRAEERAIARENRGSAKANMPKLDELLGAASQQLKANPIFRDTGNILGAIDSPEGKAIYDSATPGLTSSLAFSLGKLAGVPEMTLAGLYAPGKQSSITTAVNKLSAGTPDAAVKALSSKYARRGVTPQVAATIIKDKEFTGAVQWLLAGADGKPRDEVESILRANFLSRKTPKTRTYEVLVGEYLDSLPTIQQQVGAAKAREQVG